MRVSCKTPPTEASAQSLHLSTPSGPRNWLPVLYAAYMGHLDVVKVLKQHGSPMPSGQLLNKAMKVRLCLCRTVYCYCIHCVLCGKWLVLCTGVLVY
jgi:hypothetical protein